MRTAPALRSLLYVPGDRVTWVDKAWAAGADAVILDLEDGVAPERKPAARAGAAQTLAAAPEGRTGELWVRIDPKHLEADLDAVVLPRLRGVTVPKADPDLVRAVTDRLDALEATRGLDVGAVAVLPVIETAVGIQQIAQLSALPRVLRMSLGEADLAADLGLVPDAARSQLLPLRTALVVASAAAGLLRPVGPVHTSLQDMDGLRSSTHELYRQGYRARTAVHPSQVAVINEVLTPSTAEIDSAREVLAAYESSVRAGSGAVRGPGGALLDAATVRGAREVLARVGIEP